MLYTEYSAAKPKTAIVQILPSWGEQYGYKNVKGIQIKVTEEAGAIVVTPVQGFAVNPNIAGDIATVLEGKTSDEKMDILFRLQEVDPHIASRLAMQSKREENNPAAMIDAINELSHFLLSNNAMTYEKYNIRREGGKDRYTPINERAKWGSTTINGSEVRAAKSNNTPGVEKAYLITIGGEIQFVAELRFTSPNQRDTSRRVFIKSDKTRAGINCGVVKNATMFEKTWLQKIATSETETYTDDKGVERTREKIVYKSSDKKYYAFMGNVIKLAFQEISIALHEGAKPAEQYAYIGQSLSIDKWQENLTAVRKLQQQDNAETMIKRGCESGLLLYHTLYEREYAIAKETPTHEAYSFRANEERVVISSKLVAYKIACQLSNMLARHSQSETRLTSDGISLLTAFRQALIESEQEAIPSFDALFTMLTDQFRKPDTIKTEAQTKEERMIVGYTKTTDEYGNTVTIREEKNV